ncbi:hypothetical protein BDV19DRAFT_352702 [Aspergillus venezuelensis]
MIHQVGPNVLRNLSVFSIELLKIISRTTLAPSHFRDCSVLCVAVIISVIAVAAVLATIIVCFPCFLQECLKTTNALIYILTNGVVNVCGSGCARPVFPVDSY